MNWPEHLARGLFGPLILKPSLLQATDLTDLDFAENCLRRAFQEISSLWEAGHPSEIDLRVLAERLGGTEKDVAFVASLLDGNTMPSEQESDRFCFRVREFRRDVEYWRMSEEAKAGQDNPEKIWNHIQALRELGDPRDGGEEPALERMGRTFGELRQLDLHVEWLVDRLIPLRAITQIHAKTGTGKTWIGLELVKALVTGSPFFGIPTRRTEKIFYADYEMPLDLMKERAEALDLYEGRLWNVADTPPPPRLDSDGWKIFLQAPEGSVTVFDSLRSAFSMKGNDDDVAYMVMTRARGIRDRGGSVIMFHHTGWSDEKRSKGNTAWVDLADCVLSLHRVKPKTFEAIEDEDDDPNALYYFGSGEKSRYARFHVYLRRSPSGSLVLTQDPASAVLDQIAEVISGSSMCMNQGVIIQECGKAEIGPKKKQAFIQLLDRGEREGRWTTHKGLNNAKFYELPKT